VPGSADRPVRSHAPDQPDASEMPGQLRTASPRPEPGRADEARPADAAGGRSGDERVPWSRADLQQRLERLPPGHPSSPRAVDADIPHRGDGPDREPDALKRNYWSEVPRFLRAWADHVRRWPAERAAVAVDRSRDPEGSWRGDGNQYLDPEQHAETKDVIARVLKTEEALTKRMGDAELENSSGGWLAGLEFRLKGEGRLKEKIAEKIEHEPGRTPMEALAKINDAIRYTFCFEAASYAHGYQEFKHWLEARDYKMVYSKNHWRDDPEYKGVNTRWITTEGQRFEIQFHTAESFHAKQQVTHKCYERLRNPLTSDDERQELRAFQRDVCSRLAVPEGAPIISDYPPERP
jgi:hypothetical protein